MHESTDRVCHEPEMNKNEIRRKRIIFVKKGKSMNVGETRKPRKNRLESRLNLDKSKGIEISQK